MNLKNKLISVVLSMTMLISVFPFSAITASALTESDIITMDDITDTDTPPVISDDGKDWYEISTLRQLMWFTKQVNSGNSSINARLLNDINLEPFCHQQTNKYSGQSWEPIGNTVYYYTGTFDGCNHSLQNFYYKEGQGEYVGLFGCIGSGCTIKNLTLDKGTMNARRIQGGFAAFAKGENILIDNCYNNLTNFGARSGGSSWYNRVPEVISTAHNDRVGGILGVGEDVTNLVISNCINYVTTTGGNELVGGICACIISPVKESCKIYNCAMTGNMQGRWCMGGILGLNYHRACLIEDCYFIGKMTQVWGTGKNGGIAYSYPESPDLMTDCFSTVSVEGVDEVTDVTDETVSNGELAWFMQEHKSNPEVMDWGQNLTVSPYDKYPVSTTDGDLRVIRVVYYIKGEDEGSYTKYATKYTNVGKPVTFPEDVADTDSKAFYKWSKSTDPDDSSSYVNKTDAVNYVDETETPQHTLNLYAIAETKYGAVSDSNSVELSYSRDAQTLNLAEYAEYADLSLTEGRFEYTVTAQDATGYNFTTDGDNLNVPASLPFGTYHLTISATQLRPYFALFSATYDTVDFTFSLTINIEPQSVEVPETGSKIYNGENQKANIDDTEMYSVTENNGGTNAGEYDVKLSLTNKSNYVWADGTTTDKTVKFNITPKSVKAPSINETSFVYNADEQKPTVNTDGTDTNSYNIQYPPQSINAGTYSVTFTLNNPSGIVNYIWEDGTIADVVCGYEITKQTIEPPAVDGKLYTGTVLTADVPANPHYSVTQNNGGTQAGKYPVVLTLTDSANYKWMDSDYPSVTLDFIISTSAIDLPSVADKVYNGQLQKANLNTNALYEVVTNNGGTDVGEYSVTVKPSSSCTWDDGTRTEKTITYRITPQQVAHPDFTITDKVYNGETQKADNIPVSDLYTITNNGGVNAGTYDVILSLNNGEKKNYVWDNDPTGADKAYKFKINPKAVTVPEVTNLTQTYTGETLRATVPASEEYTVTNKGGVNVGAYDVTISLANKTNYIWNDNTTSDKKFTLEITKAPASFIPPQPRSVYVSTTAQELITAGRSDDGTVYYAVDAPTGWSTEIPKRISYGTYKVYYYVAGDANHISSEASFVEADILRRTPAPDVTARKLTYTGANLQLADTDPNFDGSYEYEVWYSLDSGEEKNWSKAIPTAVDADSYTVYYKVDENDYYEGIEGNVTVTIDKATPKVSMNTYTWEYDGSEKLLAYATSDFGAVKYKINSGEWQSEYPKAINAGEYTVYYKIEETDNVKAADGDISTEIYKYNPALNPVGINEIYSDTDYALLSCSALPEFCKVEYSLNGTDWTTDIPKARNAGIYNVLYRITDNNGADNVMQKNGTIKSEIRRRRPTINASYSPYIYFDNSEGSYSLITASADYGTVYYTVSTDNGATWRGETTTVPEATDTGTYLVKYYVKADSNVEASEENTITVHVEEKDPQISIDVDAAIVYTGEPVNLIKNIEAEVKNPTPEKTDNPPQLKYMVNPDTVPISASSGDWSADAPKGTDVGVYTVYYCINPVSSGGDSLYTEQIFSVTVNIVPKEPEAPADINTIYGTNLNDIKSQLPEYYSFTDNLITKTGDVGEHTFKVHYHNTDNANYAEMDTTVKVIVSEARENTPAIDIDYEQEQLIGFDPASSYTLNNEEEAHISSLDIDKDMLDSSVEIVAKSSDKNHGDSEAQTLSIPKRPDEPNKDSIEVRQAQYSSAVGRLYGIGADMEYSINGGDWVKGTGDEVATAQGNTVMVRYAASNTLKRFKSAPYSIEIKEYTASKLDTPDAAHIAIDFINEKLTGLDADSRYKVTDRNNKTYQITTDENGRADIDEEWMGESINFAKLGDILYTEDSDPSDNISIPERPDAPDATGGEAAINNVDNTMQWRKTTELGTEQYQNIVVAEGSASVTKAPDDYDVRYAATATSFASEAKQVTVTFAKEQTPEPMPDYPYIANLDKNAIYEVTDPSGAVTTVTSDSEGRIPAREEWIEKTILLVRKGDGVLTVDSEAAEVEIHKQSQNAPDITAADQKITGVDDTMEYRKKGDENWISVPEGATEITELPAGEYEVRYKETEDKYASEPAVVTVTESDEPVVEPTAEPARKRGHSSRSSATPSPSPSPSASTSPITEPDATTEPSHGSGTPSLNASDHFAYINGYLDGSFKPENKIKRAEVAVIFAQLLNDEMGDENYVSSFGDVSPDAYYSRYIGFLERYGILTGYEDGTFRPETYIKRAEFSVIVSKFANISETEKNLFTDVVDSDWATPYILKAHSAGYLDGYEDGSFHPYSDITRAETVSVINRVLGRVCDKEYVNENSNVIKLFNDVNASHWAYNDIIEASNAHKYENAGGAEHWTELE